MMLQIPGYEWKHYFMEKEDKEVLKKNWARLKPSLLKDRKNKQFKKSASKIKGAKAVNKESE